MCIIVRFISLIYIEFQQCPFALNCTVQYGILSSASSLWRLGYNSKQVLAHFFHLLYIWLGNLLWWLICRLEVLVSRHGLPHCIVLVELFFGLHEEEDPLLVLVKHADLHCMEEFWHREVTHNTWSMSKLVECLANMVQRMFSMSCLCVGIAESSI